MSERGDRPKDEKRSLFRELGLPYVSDPAVTRHLNAFLEPTGQVPDAILFNGGFFIPEILPRARRRRGGPLVRHAARRFSRIAISISPSPRGAAYYSYVRSTGSGVLVRGGLPRAYYIGLGEPREGKFPAVCLVPRGAEEGATLEIDRDDAATGRQPARLLPPVQLAHAHRRHARAGGRVRRRRCRPAPARAAQRRDPLRQESRGAPGPGEARRAPDRSRHARNLVRFEDQRQSLAPAVRTAQAGDGSARGTQGRGRDQRGGAEGVAGADRSRLLAHGEIAHRARGSCRRSSNRPWAWARTVWPLSAIRQLADAFLDAADGRKKSPAYEVRWLNLVRLLPAPRLRLSRRRFPHRAGAPHLRRRPDFANQVQSEIEWWIFWGRVAGGLNRNQQTDVYQRLSALPAAARRQEAAARQPSLLREMWRTAASLELLPLGTKTELGDALVKRVKAGDFKDSELWCLARLGARKLFYGPINQVIPPATVARWVEALLRLPAAGDALAAMARRTEDPTRDLPAATRDAVRSKLQTLPHADRCSPCSMARKRTTGRSAASSARNCLPAWCWLRPPCGNRPRLPPSCSGRFTTSPVRMAVLQ